MKKHIIIGLFIALFALPFGAKSQVFLGEAFVGYNICQVDGDMIMGFFKHGVNVGVGVIVPVWTKDKFSLSCRWKCSTTRKAPSRAANIGIM